MNEIEKIKDEISILQAANKINIANANDSIDKKVVKAVIEDMVRVVTGSFVDMPKIYAPKIAKILDAPEREGEIEKVLTDMIEETTNKIVKEIK